MILTLVAVTIFVVVPAVVVVILLSREGPKPIELVDDFKVGPGRFSKDEMEKRMKGNSIVVGKDIATNQPYVMPERIRRSSTIIVGRTGVGKSTLINSAFLSKDIANKDMADVVFDPLKSDISDEVIARCKKDDRELICYPGAGFNPLGGWGTSEERAEAFSNLFAQVNGNTTSDAGKYFLRQAQLFIRRAIPLFEAAYKCPMTLRELYLLATNEQMRERTLSDAGDCPEGRYFIEGTKAWSLAMWASNTSDLCGMIDSILVGDRKVLYCDRNAPALEDHIENKRVILIQEGSYKNTTEHILGLMFMIKVQEFARRRQEKEDNPLVAVYMDEAYQYFNDQYPAFLSQCRHKNIAQTLAFQSFKHLEPFTTLLTTNCSTWIILPGLLPEDATFVADTIGKRLHRHRSSTRQDGAARASETVSYGYGYLVEPHRIMDLSEGEAIVLSQRGRERDIARFIKLVDKLQIATEHYQEPAKAHDTLPELIWDQVLKLSGPAIDRALTGDSGALGKDIAVEGAPDWLVDDGEPGSA